MQPSQEEVRSQQRGSTDDEADLAGVVARDGGRRLADRIRRVGRRTGARAATLEGGGLQAALIQGQTVGKGRRRRSSLVLHAIVPLVLTMGVSELRELRLLRDENARLKRLVADLTLDKQILSDVVKKKI